MASWHVRFSAFQWKINGFFGAFTASRTHRADDCFRPVGRWAARASGGWSFLAAGRPAVEPLAKIPGSCGMACPPDGPGVNECPGQETRVLVSGHLGSWHVGKWGWQLSRGDPSWRRCGTRFRTIQRGRRALSPSVTDVRLKHTDVISTGDSIGDA